MKLFVSSSKDMPLSLRGSLMFSPIGEAWPSYLCRPYFLLVSYPCSFYLFFFF